MEGKMEWVNTDTPHTLPVGNLKKKYYGYHTFMVSIHGITPDILHMGRSHSFPRTSDYIQLYPASNNKSKIITMMNTYYLGSIINLLLF